jgi:hypothetical protein
VGLLCFPNPRHEMNARSLFPAHAHEGAYRIIASPFFDGWFLRNFIIGERVTSLMSDRSSQSTAIRTNFDVSRMALRSTLDKLSGWCRAALVFSMTWIACVSAVVLYEEYVAIGSPAGKYAALFDYNTLIFHGVYRNGAHISFWLQTQRFWTVLLLPICLAWATAAILHASRWVRRGFQ